MPSCMENPRAVWVRSSLPPLLARKSQNLARELHHRLETESVPLIASNRSAPFPVCIGQLVERMLVSLPVSALETPTPLLQRPPPRHCLWRRCRGILLQRPLFPAAIRHVQLEVGIPADFRHCHGHRGSLAVLQGTEVRGQEWGEGPAGSRLPKESPPRFAQQGKPAADDAAIGISLLGIGGSLLSLKADDPMIQRL